MKRHAIAILGVLLIAATILWWRSYRDSVALRADIETLRVKSQDLEWRINRTCGTVASFYDEALKQITAGRRPREDAVSVVAHTMSVVLLCTGEFPRLVGIESADYGLQELRRLIPLLEAPHAHSAATHVEHIEETP